MAEQHSMEGASTSTSGGASVSAAADSTVELNIKTLDSQIYSFRVEKNMLVSSFKGKIADQVGVPVGQQRLIFRGKVLKDEHVLSEYHVENGDTLHLVERQVTQPQTSSGSGSADASGTDANAEAPRNRIGQISHSVVLGTLNLGEQGEGGASDFSRVIGAVLNSLGVGNLPTNAAFGAPNTAAANASGPTPQDSDTEQGRNGNGSQNQAGNQTQFGQPFVNQPFHIPLAGLSIPPPSLNTPIPDSLKTISEFMTCMEGVLSQNGSSHPGGVLDQSSPELPSNARGLHTPEALGIVLRHAQRFLSGPAVAALSQIAGRIEQEAESTDASVRSQIQSESVQVGLAMQHIGALLLELGRTTMMLRMGQSPSEAVVNAGHAVYISPSGPNPIMVQPFPHQASPLFNTPASSAPSTGTSVPVGILGGAPRNINIHIHAGTSLNPIVSGVGARAGGGEGAQGDQTTTASGESRALPVRNIIATSIPPRTATATIAVSPVVSVSQPIGNNVSTPELPDAAAVSTVISQVNSRIRNFLENMRTENQTPTGQQENPVVPSSAGSGGGATTTTTDVVDPSKSGDSESSAGARELHIGSPPGQQSQEDATERKENVQNNSSQSNVESLSSLEPSSSSGVGELSDNSAGAKQAPLGLGGGLQPKRRSRPSKMQPTDSEAGPSSNPEQSQQARITGQQILQTLASRSTPGGSNVANNGAGQTQLGLGQPQQRLGQSLDSSQASNQGLDRQVDVSGMMNELLESPAINGLLSGVAQQTGVGSPNVLRNMLQQFTQNPAMRNTVNQLAQQVDREELTNMFSGEGGNLDFASMFQQMMPVVSQVLGGGSVQNDQLRNMVPELLPQVDERSLGVDSSGLVSQDNIQEVVQRIALNSPSQDIFRAMLQNAAFQVGANEADLVDALSNNQDLTDQFLEMLRNDMRNQLSEN